MRELKISRETVGEAVLIKAKEVETCATLGQPKGVIVVR